ncbi:MAG: hypothetical protein NTY60_11620 [Proteobacteria bacterium]|nr:hypothetical protein [Pseudomonadota bacterium]
MKIVGKKSEPILSPVASGELLMRAALFNEMMQSVMPYGKSGYIPKGVYRFKSHRDANQQQDDIKRRSNPDPLIRL